MGLSDELNRAKQREALEIDIKGRATPIFKTHEKFIQAYNLYIEILKKRTRVLSSIKRTLSKKEQLLKKGLISSEDFNRGFISYLPRAEIKNLSSCNNREKQLIRTVKNSEEKTLKLLVIPKFNRRVRNGVDYAFREKYGFSFGQTKRLFSVYSKIIKTFYKNYNYTLERLEAEREFIDKKTIPLYERYISLFSKEMNKTKKIEKSIRNLQQRKPAANARVIIPGAVGVIGATATLTALCMGIIFSLEPGVSDEFLLNNAFLDSLIWFILPICLVVGMGLGTSVSFFYSSEAYKDAREVAYFLNKNVKSLKA